MSQGSVKKKASSIAKKGKSRKKSLGPKKGGRAIKPKKASKTSVSVVKKKLEVGIKQSIEVTAVLAAAKQEHKPLALIKSPTSAPQNKKTKAKKGTRKK